MIDIVSLLSTADSGCDTCGHTCKCGKDYCPNHRTKSKIRDDIAKLDLRKYNKHIEVGA